MNRYAAKLEEALEENLWLKRKAGLPEDITIDVADLKLARQGQMMQVKAMNAMLEEENMRLEEDVRRLKHEVRFRTKWEGLNAAGEGGPLCCCCAEAMEGVGGEGRLCCFPSPSLLSFTFLPLGERLLLLCLPFLLSVFLSPLHLVSAVTVPWCCRTGPHPRAAAAP